MERSPRRGGRVKEELDLNYEFETTVLAQRMINNLINGERLTPSLRDDVQYAISQALAERRSRLLSQMTAEGSLMETPQIGALGVLPAAQEEELGGVSASFIRKEKEKEVD